MALLTGQTAVTGTAAQLDSVFSAASCVSFLIRAPLTNTEPVFIGPAGVSTSTGHQLDQGQEFTYERINQNGQPPYQLRPSDFWVVGTSGDKVTWLASA